MTERLIQIHNLLTQISVRGEDTLKMADAIMAMRQLIAESRSAETLPEAEEEVAGL